MADIELEGQVASLDSVPEAYKASYTKVGDVFILGKIKIEDTAGLKSAAQARADERDAARAEVRAAKDAGFTLEEWNEYQASKETKVADDLKKKGDWETNEKRIRDANKVALDAKDAEIARKDKALHSEMIVSRATKALVEAGANEQGLDWLTPKLVGALKIVDEGGTLIPRVVDESGEVRRNASGNPMTEQELAAEFKSNEKYGSAFKASGAGGTGSQPNAGGGGNGAVRTKADLKTDADKSAYIHEHGSEKYLDLPAAPAAAAK